MDPENAGREKAGNNVFRKIPEKTQLSLEFLPKKKNAFPYSE
ncbi:MAG TPA: hypothetical protein PK445_04210 [Methanolinea sp.]|jgi:hypothetical protein|nr:hypothetical protein [Methanolinea sp.]HOS81907.1 hypothetical protein [Methanolinea sp.]HQE85626.1 hypothetical protein [Methanolinea sp.]HQI14441.1 hypothetical protein [Methanolinea sp.]HQJ18859.1 hypothetical protein [Methanolinea sp.]